jgi:hypothetical protein
LICCYAQLPSTHRGTSNPALLPPLPATDTINYEQHLLLLLQQIFPLLPNTQPHSRRHQQARCHISQQARTTTTTTAALLLLLQPIFQHYYETRSPTHPGTSRTAATSASRATYY